MIKLEQNELEQDEIIIKRLYEQCQACLKERNNKKESLENNSVQDAKPISSGNNYILNNRNYHILLLG